MSGQKALNVLQNEVDNMRASLLKKRIDELAELYGSVRAVGNALKIDHAYLYRLRQGEKKNPSKTVLVKLGLA